MDELQINKNIAQSAQNAVDVITKAAEAAAKVVANSASEALKAVNAKGERDHDLLIEIKTKLSRVIDDVAKINENFVSKIDKLECDKADKAEIILLHDTTLKRLEKIDIKVDALEQWRYYIAGGLVIAASVVSYIIQKYL